MQWSWPYIRDGPNAWEPKTSETNFCEIDNYVTPYIVEFVNTISNIGYLWLAYHGAKKVRENDGDRTLVLGYVLLAGVGVGSVLFHGSLKYSCQLIDELAMLYATSLVLYVLFRRHLRGPLLPLSLLLLNIVITLLNHYSRSGGASYPHRISFGAMIATVGLRCMHQMRRLTPFPAHAKNLRTLCLIGSISFVSGFAVWIVDVVTCEHLLNFRDMVGFPWGVVTELHAWWHILTAYGVYWYIVFVEYLDSAFEEGEHLREAEEEGGQRVGLEWAGPWGCLPHVVRADRRRRPAGEQTFLAPSESVSGGSSDGNGYGMMTNGHVNGSGKGKGRKEV